MDIHHNWTRKNTEKPEVFLYPSPTCTFLPRQGCFTVIHPFPLLRRTPGSVAFLTTRNFISGAVNVCWDELWAAKDRGSILVTSDIKDTYERDTGGGEWWLTHSELRSKAAVSRLGDVFIAGQLLCHLWMLKWQRLVSQWLALNLLISPPSEQLTCCTLWSLTRRHFA